MASDETAQATRVHETVGEGHKHTTTLEVGATRNALVGPASSLFPHDHRTLDHVLVGQLAHIFIHTALQQLCQFGAQVVDRGGVGGEELPTQCRLRHSLSTAVPWLRLKGLIPKAVVVVVVVVVVYESDITDTRVCATCGEYSSKEGGCTHQWEGRGGTATTITTDLVAGWTAHTSSRQSRKGILSGVLISTT